MKKSRGADDQAQTVTGIVTSIAVSGLGKTLRKSSWPSMSVAIRKPTPCTHTLAPSPLYLARSPAFSPLLTLPRQRSISRMCRGRVRRRRLLNLFVLQRLSSRKTGELSEPGIPWRVKAQGGCSARQIHVQGSPESARSQMFMHSRWELRSRSTEQYREQ